MKNKIISYILCFIFITICSLTFATNVYARENNKYQFVLEKQIKVDQDQNGIYINNNLYLLYNPSTINIYSSTGNLTINDCYQDYFYQDNNLYICTKSSLYIININLLSFKEYVYDLDIYGIYVDEYIFLVGCQNLNPSINLINKQGEVIKNEIYIGSGYATFKTINKIDDKYIVTGEKDAFFDNQEFLKVGNDNDLKSFLFVFDKTLRKQNDYYFNEYTENEFITSIETDNLIKVILHKSDKEVLYLFDHNINLINRMVLDEENNHYIVPNILDEVLLIKKKTNSFEILIAENNALTSILNIPFKLNSFNMTSGGIVLNYNNSMNVYSEYHINSINTLAITKIKYEYDSTNHFEVKSFFEKLTFKLDHYTPFHMHMMSGNYVATYVARNTFGKEIYIQTDVIVRNFVNVVNGGVYNINTVLQFFGDAMLNGESINNGHTIQTPGKYELVITNINGVQKKYIFEVVNEYYKDNDHYVVDIDYVLNQGEELIIDLEFVNLINVEYLVINDEKYYDYKIENNHLYLNIKSLSDFGYQNIYINYLVCNGATIDINKNFSILTKKKAPSFSISSSVTNNEYQIYINYEDKDNTLVDLFYKNNQDKKSTYLNDAKFVNNTGSIYISYELGDGIVLEEKIIDFEGKNIEYDVSFVEGGIQINLKSNSSLKNVSVKDKNIYQETNNKINLYIIAVTIISSLLLIIIFPIIFVINRKRRKTNLI